MSASLHPPDGAGLGRAEAELRRRLDHPSRPKRLWVHLTRLQIDVLFPRLRDRFPLEREVVGLTGRERLDLRHRVEVWPVSLERRP